MSTRMETPLGRVRGLGPARHGAHDWWAVRLNSVALLVLYAWLAVSLLLLPSLDRTTVVEWLADPLAAVPMALLVAATFWHVQKGLREVVDDYVHDEGKVFWLVLLTFFTLGGGALGVFAVLKIAFGGAA